MFYLICPLNVWGSDSTIKIGLLHSITGETAIYEQGVVDATLLAIEDINKNRLLAKKIIVILKDGKSDPQVFAKEAENLLEIDKVCAIFGCWSSESRHAVLSKIEKYQSLLFYPVSYEGLENSPFIIHTGAVPNQQVIPSVNWIVNNLGNKLFLIGNKTIYSNVVNFLCKAILAGQQGSILGEEYVSHGLTDFSDILAKIKTTQPDIIINTMDDDATNMVFIKQLRKMDETVNKIPTLSFRITEQHLEKMGVENFEDHYIAWSYFQSIQSRINKQFVTDFKNKYGEKKVITDPMESAYFSCFLWANAVKDAGTTEPLMVRKFITNKEYEAPEGVVFVDANNYHTWKMLRIGQIKEKEGINIVWTSNKPIRPVPFPIYQTKDKWNEYLEDLAIQLKE